MKTSIVCLTIVVITLIASITVVSVSNKLDNLTEVLSRPVKSEITIEELSTYSHGTYSSSSFDIKGFKATTDSRLIDLIYILLAGESNEY